MKTASISGKKYGVETVDDYRRWPRVNFLRHKDESHSVFITFCNQVQNKNNISELLKSEVIMMGNLKTKDLKTFLMRMASLMISLVLEILKKMEV